MHRLPMADITDLVEKLAGETRWLPKLEELLVSPSHYSGLISFLRAVFEFLLPIAVGIYAIVVLVF